jgi:hypothetical protein
MAAMNLDAAAMLRSVTLTITVTRSTKVRMWLGTRLMIIGARILGTSVNIIEVDDPTEQAGT